MQKYFFICFIFFFSLTSFGQDVFFNQEAGYFNVDAQGLLVGGYDVVAYFEKNKAIKGNANFELSYKGAKLRFETAQHLALFQANPEKYLPQFGGWCALGLIYAGQNWGFPSGKYPVNPTEFVIENQKLYLFFEIPKRNVRKTWTKESEKYLPQAQAQWERLHDTTLPATYHYARKNREVWQRSTAYMIAVAQAMPDSAYDFKPTDNIFSFREQLQHLTQSMYRLQKYVSQEESPFRDISFTDKNKEQIIGEMQRAFGQIAELLAKTPDHKFQEKTDFFVKELDMNKEAAFEVIKTHLAHHRAECIIYLRLKGIKAPAYVGW